MSHDIFPDFRFFRIFRIRKSGFFLYQRDPVTNTDPTVPYMWSRVIHFAAFQLFIAPQGFSGPIWWADSENAQKFQIGWHLRGAQAPSPSQYWAPILWKENVSIKAFLPHQMDCKGLLVILELVSSYEMTIFAKKSFTLVNWGWNYGQFTNQG